MSVISDTEQKTAFAGSILDSRDSLGLPVPMAWKTASEEALATMAFPTSKTEAWKYTRTGKLSAKRFVFSPDQRPIDISRFIISKADDCRLVFVNGFYRPDLSNAATLPGLTIIPSVEAGADQLDILKISEPDIFTALNVGAFNGGVHLRVTAGTAIDPVVHLLFVTTTDGSVAQPRNAIIIEKNAQLNMVEQYVSIGHPEALTNSVTEVEIKENASLERVIIQADADAHFHVNHTEIRQERNSRMRQTTVTADGGWVRNQVRVNIEGEGCETNLYGTYLPVRKQHVDNRTIIDHRVAHCESNELYKGLLGDQSTGVFNGKVFVRQDAQKTNAFQKNANILISDHATMNSKPELEIYADDVKCSHGSTTGRLDEEGLFYLMSRGISRESARGLLASAFIGDIVNHISSTPVREKVRQILAERKGLTFE